MNRFIHLLLSANLLLSPSMGVIVNAKTINKSEQTQSTMTKESKQKTQLESEASEETKISSLDKPMETMENIEPPESSDLYEQRTQETPPSPKNDEDMDILKKIKEQNKPDIENSRISNKLSVKDTGKPFGEEHVFSESINVQSITPLKDVDLVIEIDQPYKGWLDEKKITTPDVYGADKATKIWVSDTKLQIVYHFPDFNDSVQLAVPIKVTSGNRVGSNPENPTIIHSYLKTEDGQQFGSSEGNAELTGKINEIGFWDDSLNSKLLSGEGELVNDGLRGWKYNTYDTELTGGKLDGMGFTVSDLTLRSPKIYLGKIEFGIFVPEDIVPVINDSQRVSFNKSTRILTYQTDQSIDNTETGNTEISFENTFSFITYKLPNNQQRTFSYTIYGVNDLDKNYRYPLSTGKNYSFVVNAVPKEEQKKVTILGDAPEDNYYIRNYGRTTVTGKVSLQSTTSDALNYSMNLTQEEDTGVTVSPKKVMVSLGAFEGSYNLYLSNDGTTNGKLLAENIKDTKFSIGISEKNYRYVLLKTNEGFHQKAAFSSITNEMVVDFSLDNKEKIYPNKESELKNFTASFTADGEQKSFRKVIAPARNIVQSNLTSDKQNVTANESFTDSINLSMNSNEYYEGRGTFLALMPEGAMLNSVTSNGEEQLYQVIHNYKESGKKAIVFYDETLDRLKSDKYYKDKKIVFSYKGTNKLAEGPLSIDYYYVLPESYQEKEKQIGYNSPSSDALDINDNGNTDEKVNKVTSNYIYRRTKELIPSISAKGSASDTFLGNSDVTKSYADKPDFDVKLELFNNFDSVSLGNLTQIVKIPKKDILNFSGVKEENDFDASLSGITLPDTSNFDVYYLTEDVQQLSTTNESDYKWTKTQPELGKVTALKFISKGSYQLNPQNSLEINFSIKATGVSEEHLDHYLNSSMIYRSGSGEYLETSSKKMQVVSAKQDLNIHLVSTNENELKEGSFDLYDAQDVFIQNYKLDNQSSIVIPDLDGGKYFIKQIEKNDNYQYLEQEQTVELSGITKNEKTSTFVNRPKAVSFGVNDSTLYLGDSWKPEDNILIKDFEGVNHSPSQNSGYDSDYTSEGTVNTLAPGQYSINYQLGTTTKKATIQVIKGLVTDPSDSGTVLEGKDGDQNINSYPDMLKINYISDLDFGKATYNYDIERGLSVRAKKDNNWKGKELSPFVNVENRRDTNGYYTISAQLTRSFTDAETHSKLKGAVLYYNLGATAYKPSETKQSVFVLQEDFPPSRVVESNRKGSKSLSFDSVQLLLPCNVYQRPGSYTAEITWSIEVGP
ncbi:WxL domain-containing protein [Lactococcus lactis]|uniref:WxL domain-containing protein n=1 Tax=Lactococcus lactis TaxID=1358 RepID=UPI002417AF87|nr:WxL domain-containing protein [Lactococcus lactis]MDG4974932.1 WxL domain-containing protein [Lactococcus lactis]